MIYNVVIQNFTPNAAAAGLKAREFITSAVLSFRILHKVSGPQEL
jgi:hypothetical protein